MAKTFSFSFICFLCISINVFCSAEGLENDEDVPDVSLNPNVTKSKKETIAEHVEHIVKEEFQAEVREAEEHRGSAYNESASSGQVFASTRSFL